MHISCCATPNPCRPYIRAPYPSRPYIRNPYPPSSIHPCPRLPQVLKAQLVMIRGQGIDPLTTPAYHKFKLFTRLRRWVIGYFILHTFIIISQVLAMNLWQRVLLLVIWELVQLAITSAIGWLFKSGSGSNVYLDREEHLPLAQVAHVVEAHEMSLSWNDDADFVVAEDGAVAPVGRPTSGPAVLGTPASSSLTPWQEGMPVPPPPAPPPTIAIFRVQQPRAGGRTRTQPTAAPGQGQPVSGVPVGAATPAPPHHEAL